MARFTFCSPWLSHRDFSFFSLSNNIHFCRRSSCKSIANIHFWWCDRQRWKNVNFSSCRSGTLLRNTRICTEAFQQLQDDGSLDGNDKWLRRGWECVINFLLAICRSVWRFFILMHRPIDMEVNYGRLFTQLLSDCDACEFIGWKCDDADLIKECLFLGMEVMERGIQRFFLAIKSQIEF